MKRALVSEEVETKGRENGRGGKIDKESCGVCVCV